MPPGLKLILIIILIWSNALSGLANQNKVSDELLKNTTEQADKDNEKYQTNLSIEQDIYNAIKDEIKEYNKATFKHNRQLYQFQFVTSIIIFIITVFIIILGLWLSWLQFAKKSFEQKEANSSLEVGLTGIKINSDILGLLILIISLAFFYLYLKTVYPITTTTEQNLLTNISQQSG